MARLATMLTIAAVVLAGATAAPARAQTFDPAWDAACGKGTDLAGGCGAVRARTIVDASAAPWRAIGRINFAGYRSKLHCTGALVGERLVLTAAHCLYHAARKKWLAPDSIHFLAGYQRGTFVAHATATRYVVDEAHDPASGRFRFDPESDWALVELSDPIGAITGVLAWAAIGQADLDRALESGARIGLAGYPKIREHVQSASMACAEPRFFNRGRILAAQCASMQGDSGAPVLLIGDGPPQIVAVHSGIVRSEGALIPISTPVATFRDALERALAAAPNLHPSPE